MKQLMIMRHAKSNWSTGETDFERPLNARGEKAAPLMGAEIKKRNIIPDLIISSTAERAKQTALKVAEAANYINNIEYNEKFYFGSEDNVLVTLKLVSNKHNRVMVIGHNPTWEKLAMSFCKEKTFISMSTATLVLINFDIDHWKHLKYGIGKLSLVRKVKELSQI